MRGLTLPLLLLAALTFLVGLGRGAITDADEAFYAEASREMVESGDFITPAYNYEPRFQKPILYYWLTAGTFLVTGEGEAPARFWAAMSGVGLVLLTAACARRWFDDGVALLSAAIVATSFGYYAIGRMALPDLPLTFFITAAIVCGWMATLETTRHHRRWVLAAAAALALGFLTKGPVGVVIPLLVVVPVVLLERRSLNVSVGDALTGAVVFAVIGLPWYFAMYATHGTAYLESFFLGDNLERFATDRFNDPRPWWYYGPVVLGGLLPWAPLCLVWVSPVWRFLTRRKDIETLELRLLLWAGLPLLFYSLSVGKQPRYILPVLPPLAILLAVSVLERTRDWRSLDGARVRIPRPRVVGIGAAIAGGLLVTLSALLWRAEPLLLNVSTPYTMAAALLIAASGMAVIIVGLSGAWRQIPLTLTIAAAITFPALQYGALSGTGESTVEQVARAVLSARQLDQPVGTHHVFVRNLVYYTHVKTEDLMDDAALAAFLDQDRPVIVVAPAPAIASYEMARGRPLRRLAEFPYFNEAGVRLRTLLWPDPTRDVSTAVIVTNR
ncbi:MAG: glycosyltransferase family 39 protein [Acidobacteria bacterium]|nr:glycosyltransferase family 39 protein [Acidobacteriota bacterium]